MEQMEDKEKREGFDNHDREEIYSKVVRAGKRTYFFDVKATRKEDYYLTITESKKVFDKEGRFHFEKHKLFLYKEDFDKFADGFRDAVDYIKATQGEYEPRQYHAPEEKTDNEFSSVEFDDLESPSS